MTTPLDEDRFKLYRYFFLNSKKNIFSSITQLDCTYIKDYLNYIKRENLAVKSYDSLYIENRLLTEKKLYDSFKEKGGVPQISHPYYFTLEKNDAWFYGVKSCFGSIEFSLKDFAPEVLSFTYGDSIPTFMNEFYDGKEYRNNVYTFKEIIRLIDIYGFPNEWNRCAKLGPENYIEVQVWDDKFINLINLQLLNGDFKILSDITTRIIRANLNISAALTQNPISFYLSKIKKNPAWNWFQELLILTPKYIFQSDIIHGYEHAQKCALMSFILGVEMNLDLDEIKTLVYAALLHDIGRKYSNHGKNHGVIGSKIVDKYINKKDVVYLKLLKEAVAKHDSAIVSNKNKFLIYLKDVDALDYLRLGISIYDVTNIKAVNSKELLRASIELNILMYIDNLYIDKIIRGVI